MYVTCKAALLTAKTRETKIQWQKKLRLDVYKETRFMIRGRYLADFLTIFRAKKENFIALSTLSGTMTKITSFLSKQT